MTCATVAGSGFGRQAFVGVGVAVAAGVDVGVGDIGGIGFGDTVDAEGMGAPAGRPATGALWNASATTAAVAPATITALPLMRPASEKRRRRESANLTVSSARLGGGGWLLRRARYARATRIISSSGAVGSDISKLL